MKWVFSTLHTTSEHSVSSTTTNTTSDAQTSAASSRRNWRHRRFKWTCPFRRKTKSGFCACAITFQKQSRNRQKTYTGRRREKALNRKLPSLRERGYR